MPFTSPDLSICSLFQSCWCSVRRESLGACENPLSDCCRYVTHNRTHGAGLDRIVYIQRSTMKTLWGQRPCNCNFWSAALVANYRLRTRSRYPSAPSLCCLRTTTRTLVQRQSSGVRVKWMEQGTKSGLRHGSNAGDPLISCSMSKTYRRLIMLSSYLGFEDRLNGQSCERLSAVGLLQARPVSDQDTSTDDRRSPESILCTAHGSTNYETLVGAFPHGYRRLCCVTVHTNVLGHC